MGVLRGNFSAVENGEERFLVSNCTAFRASDYMVVASLEGSPDFVCFNCSSLRSRFPREEGHQLLCVVGSSFYTICNDAKPRVDEWKHEEDLRWTNQQFRLSENVTIKSFPHERVDSLSQVVLFPSRGGGAALEMESDGKTALEVKEEPAHFEPVR